MIYEFKSRATGNLVMTEPVARQILSVIGKSPGPTGIITVEQIPAAIDALNAAVQREKAAGQSGSSGSRRAEDPDAGADGNEAVTLGQRAYPFIEMLQRAGAAGKDVTWGV